MDRLAVAEEAEPTITVATRLPVGLAERLRQIAAERDRSVSSLLRAICRRAIEFDELSRRPLIEPSGTVGPKPGEATALASGDGALRQRG